ncbi:MAG: hypothetical protein LQ338_002364 [Usnochroma carphineum]|nr:MAG: hypothetical protein LQ338_002364 [Usnochroma carphineum]
MRALAVLLSAHFIDALPQISDATSPNPTVFHKWSSDPACVSNACVADCRAAATTVCSSPSLSTTLNATVGDCTAFYWYDTGNTIPTKESCISAYNYINDAAKTAPNGCGGTIGGALGYDKNGNRTMDPLFAVYPRDGNANCFKAPDDNTPPKAMDELPNGDKLPLNSCPDATSRRRRSALQSLEKKGNAAPPPCFIEDLVWGFGCTAVCMTWVTALEWW